MKGQASIIAAVVSVVFVALFVTVGALIYGYVANSTPHDVLYVNETISGTYASGQQYYGEFTNYPIVNSSATPVCYNGSRNLMTNVGVGNVSLGYAIWQGRYLNITSTGFPAGRYTGIVCTYYYDWATNDQQTFWDSNISGTGAAFQLAAVIVIVTAAVAIVTIILLLKGAA